MLDDDAEKAVLTSHANPVRGSTMKPRSLPALLLIAGVLLVMAMWGQAGFAAAQDEPARVQRITDRLHAGEIHVLSSERPPNRGQADLLHEGDVRGSGPCARDYGHEHLPAGSHDPYAGGCSEPRSEEQ